MHEALFEGMNLGRFAYYLHKKPSYIHNVIQEYLKTNLAAISGLADSGVEIIFYFDDLGQRDRTILSKEAFHEFILPYYQDYIKHVASAVFISCNILAVLLMISYPIWWMRIILHPILRTRSWCQSR